MPKVWNIGNTTVRNPKRIETALKVFVEEGFSGNAKGEEIEKRLHFKLKEREVLEFEDEPSDWNGRKWRAVFYQLGFISYERYIINRGRVSVTELFNRINKKDITNPYQLTKAGENIVSANSIPEIEEIYTRQFACYELPTALENGFPEGKMKPFILFLQVLSLLQIKGLDGLNKFETGLFIQKFQNHTGELANEIVEQIIVYRQAKAKCKNVTELKELRNRYLKELQDYSQIAPRTVVGDYADTTFRYFNLSGLFARRGGTIIIRSNKKEFVNKLLESESNFLYDENPLLYLDKYYDNSYRLPTDDKEFALKEINLLKGTIRDKNNLLFKEANSLNIHSDILVIQKVRYRLIEYNNWEREEDYGNEQQSNAAIIDILKYLKVLNGEVIIDRPDIDDKPAFLEWTVWRSFLAISEIVNPIHRTRRFPVDQDFMPRNTAPGGGSDLIFEFKSYVLVVEVTLTISHRQMAVESEPVRRHTVQYKETFPDKDIYCLFIAPQVDNNVAETFRIGVWYKMDEEEFINIIPMTLSDFIKTIEALQAKRYSSTDFRNLLDRCLVYRNVRAPQWKKYITKEVSEWSKRITSN